jgi:antitoxin component YwqK of YwqJK toxin-antitoxin module
VKFTEQWAYEMGEEGDPADSGEPAKERLLEDFHVDLDAAFAAEGTYATDMTSMQETVDSQPESNVAWRWHTAKNWRGVELLHGELVYELNGRVQNSWTYRRGKLGGLSTESCSWSYRTHGDNWEYCEISEAGRYLDGLRSGEWVGTYRDGSAAYRRAYSEGQIVAGTSWYPDGRKLGEMTSEGDVVTSRYYGPDGDLTDEVSYVGSSKHGFQRMWWDNGQMREERQYDTGRPVGVWRRWDREGNLIQEDKDPKPGFPPKSE